MFSTLFTGMAKPKVSGRDIPPRKEAHGGVIDKEEGASEAKANKLPPKGGKGKRKAPVIVTPEES